ncbi:ASCH domain-containing protein [Lacimicrobium alkaliphilum]|uniref:ASCH domain-containing protein n=1 Tax=Lacimicrobium alkaliphilum TaxID=1526571 RepID=A0A0U2Z4M4_9ALTE|nr:ASCH domain-containing protein [Lacimicrobium alkaliphilum]ALS97412.1 hypothetical protein AT746_03405 [Lacimicrobium alkaliphilum]
MGMSSTTTKAWREYLSIHEDKKHLKQNLYDVITIGHTDESKNEGAKLILTGEKTTTSALLWDDYFNEKGLPFIGALSILENGFGQAVGIIETLEVKVQSISEVNQLFVSGYGEWGPSLSDWRKKAWLFYSSECRNLGKKPDPDMPLVCETFRLVHKFHVNK